MSSIIVTRMSLLVWLSSVKLPATLGDGRGARSTTISQGCWIDGSGDRVGAAEDVAGRAAANRSSCDAAAEATLRRVCSFCCATVMASISKGRTAGPSPLIHRNHPARAFAADPLQARRSREQSPRHLNPRRYLQAQTQSLSAHGSHQIALIRFPVRDPCRAEDSTRSIDRVERRQRSDLRTAPAPDARERVASFDPPL